MFIVSSCGGGVAGHGSIVFGSPALSLVLEPDLHGSRGHSKLQRQVQAHLRRGEECFFEHLVELVYLVCCRPFAFRLDYPALRHGLGIHASST